MKNRAALLFIALLSYISLSLYNVTALAQTIRLTAMKPVFYTQNGKKFITSNDKEGWLPQIAGRQFTDGINTYLNSEITYLLNGKYSRFEVWVGVEHKLEDDKTISSADQKEDAAERSKPKRRVVFKIFADGNQVFDSGMMDWETPAKKVQVDVSHVKELELIVRDAGIAGGSNRSKDIKGVNWAEPVLTIAKIAASQMTSTETAYQVKGNNATLSLNKNGEIMGLIMDKNRVALRGSTRLAQCRQLKPAEVKKLPDGGIQFTRLVEDKSGNRCTITDRFRPTVNSIRWETDIYSSGKPWSTAIITSLSYPVTAGTRFWTSWSHPDLEGQGGWNNTDLKTEWSDPLQTRKFTNSSRWFGGNPIMSVPTSGDIFSIPISTIIDSKTATGLSFIQSPEDSLLYMKLITTADGTVEYQRRYHRLGAEKHVRFAIDLVPHVDDWHSGLAWMVNRYPQYFEPVNAKALDVGLWGLFQLGG
ncbi:NPCBM/NEW2 domain-containing protein [Pedobacter sp. BS3]|uniref:NPCBM/NEW2 domain-containing protein n=1 Tax=Pedobacter sp. BS3 TaxID=2567937 RepID=UPI00165973F4|nr:NPCBM/NEW2 domain-containing protein [Pedobacter sp. BS3]